MPIKPIPSSNSAAAPTIAANRWNVYKDHRWTLNDISGIKKYVPYVELIEYKLTQSGELTSLKNNLAAIEESTTARTLAAAGIGQVLGNAVFGSGNILSRYGGAAAGAAVAATTGGLLVGSAIPGPGINYNSPYNNLYPSTPTGMVYTLPYLNIDNMTTTAGSWKAADASAVAGTLLAGATAGAKTLFGEEGEETAKKLGAVIKASREIAGTLATLGNPGAAIEQIKKFTPSEDGDKITVVFYLYNTESIDDIRKNWEFLFTLTYQNLPNRKSTNLLDPPCVYAVKVPGYKNIPVAVIEDFKVTNEGTTRIINLKTGEMVEPGQANNDSKLIPEAYKVTLTIKGLLMNTRNLYYSAFDNNNKIRVGLGFSG